MLQSPAEDRYIVNVSAMEGQFYRKNKSSKHPHTNMAKAALNMMTRTCANEFAKVLCTHCASPAAAAAVDTPNVRRLVFS